MADEREDEGRTADAEVGGEETSPVVWRYNPKEDHLLGSTLPGVPRNDLTADRVAELGIDESRLAESGLYERVENAAPRRRSRRAEGE